MNEDELLSRIESARARIEMLGDLEKHPGWVFIQEHGAQAVRVLRQNFIETPINTIDQAFKSAQTQAQMGTWQAAASIARLLREEAEAEALRAREELQVLQEYEAEQQETTNA